MNSRERVLTAMRRQTPDRVPHEVGLALTPQKHAEIVERTGCEDPAAYFGADIRFVHAAATRNRADHGRYFTDLPSRASVDEWGVAFVPTESTDARHAHLSGLIYPMLGIETVREMEEYPLPDLDAPYRYEHLPKQVAALQQQGFAVAAGMACTIFEVAWYMRSMERLLTDFVDDSPVATVLLDRITELRKCQARQYALSGADILHTGDDIGSQRGLMMSLPMWRRWLKPRLAAVIAEARAVRPDMLVFYHSDGDVTPAIPDLIEIGIDILNPVQCECMDPAAVKREYGRDLAFWGTIGTQTTLPFGTPADVRSEVRLRMETVGAGGGLLLGPTHILEPEVPFENITALVEAINEYGWYR